MPPTNDRAGPTGATTPPDADRALEAEVLELDDLRCQALLKADAALLATVVDEGLSYTHSTGRHDTKASYVGAVATGSTRYMRIEREGVTVRSVGTAAIVEGVVHMDVVIAGEQKSLTNHYLAVWVVRGGRPLMTAWASTRLP